VGLHGKVLTAGGVKGGGFCEKLLEASPCLIQSMPACSKTDPLLAKAKTISDGGSSSGVVTYIRRGKTCCGTAVKREE